MSLHPLLSSFRCLLSYWYYKEEDLAQKLALVFPDYRPPIFVDSGAFSAATRGVRIHLPDYAAWLLKYKHLFEVYANLDVIKRPDLTWTNQQRLEQEYGLHPLPVFHTATPFSWLERYLAHYPYVALGGMVGHSWRRYMGWLVQCFKMAGSRAVFHGFGVTSWEPWRSLPWYSVDSSSWTRGFRYGEALLFLPTEQKWVELKLGHRQGIYRYAEHLRRLGFDPEEFADSARTSRARVSGLLALGYLSALRCLRQLHGPIRIPQSTQTAGPHLYCASGAGLGDLASVVEGLTQIADRAGAARWEAPL